MSTTAPELDDFADAARAWLSAHAAEAPPDYGPILPPELRDEACAWQATLFDAGFAGIHWPTEVGGRGLSPDHNAAWITECALA
ncbi:MAG TPA: acyl-CoA dehydrogenase family protein, partial [Microthrixaceae bacterium]|nr:acyl-CoA dehydrogenase family protein [Microthrixaceae bacterium]